MKNIIPFFFCLCLSIMGSAQNNLFIFSENGKTFDLYLDSVKLNNLPESSVECKNLLKTSYSVTIKKGDTILINKDEVLLSWKGEAVKAKDFTYILNSTKTGYELNFLHVNETFADSTSIDTRIQEMLNDIYKANVLKDSLESEKPLTHFNEKGECILELSERDFLRVKNKLKLEKFADPKERYLKKIIAANCVTTAQLDEFLSFLSYEISRLHLAKFALPYLMDKQNAHILKKHFRFDAAKKDFENYLKSIYKP